MDSFKYKQTKYFSFFVFMTAASLLHGLIQREAIDPTKTQVGYLILLLITCFIISDRKKLLLYVHGFVYAHVMMVIINIEKLGQARLGAFKASYFLGDGNDFAWSVNIALPLCLYLLFTSKSNVLKAVYAVSSAVLLLGIIGTQSRGATLALGAGFIYYFFFITKNKSKGLVILMIAAMGVVMVAPSNYFSRMETISSYEEDTSAMGRIRAWRTAAEMATDHPILGVGAGSFNSAYGRFYRRPDDPVRWISTHSVYFKILAEYSFLGVFVYLMIIFHNLKTNHKTSRILESRPDNPDNDALWPLYLNWAIISCSVSAMFLSGVDYPHLFLLTGLTVAASMNVGRMSDDPRQEQVNTLTPWEEFCNESDEKKSS
ncbi:MAG: O-antigen ligase family protein [Gammaproteobacteria bacterium]|nr:O-antigen ligase family protein [Gammaproteobacteria bacterium]